MKKSLVYISAAAVFFFCIQTASFAATANISAGTASANPGETVDIPITLTDCDGFASLGIEIGYDSSVLSITNVTSSGVGGIFIESETHDKNPYFLGWANASNLTFNGTLATLTFTVDPDAKSGIYDISVDYYKGRDGNYEDGEDINFDENLKPVGFRYTNGSIEVGPADNSESEKSDSEDSEPVDGNTDSSGGGSGSSGGGSGSSGGRSSGGSGGGGSSASRSVTKNYTFIFSVPQGSAVTGDDITISTGNSDKSKLTGLSSSVGAVSGGAVSVTAAARLSSSQASQKDLKGTAEISYYAGNTTKTDKYEFTLN